MYRGFFMTGAHEGTGTVPFDWGSLTGAYWVVWVSQNTILMYFLREMKTRTRNF